MEKSMRSGRGRPLFDNRYDAGRQLATKLGQYKEKSVLVLAIPNGGVPVGLEVALALKADMDLVITRKIPLPQNPEAGFGALADDGTSILNEDLIQRFELTPYQINYQINRVTAEIRQRNSLYRENRPVAAVGGKTIVVTDDGLASGYTMKAAVEALRRRQPEKIVVAVPIASVVGLGRVAQVADEVITVAIGNVARFAVADFYRYWHDLSENEVIQCLKEWRLRHLRTDLEPLDNKQPDRSE